MTVINAGSANDVVLDTDSGAIDGVGTSLQITADDLQLDATTGIGATVTLRTSIATLDANTTTGAIGVLEMAAGGALSALLIIPAMASAELLQRDPFRPPADFSDSPAQPGRSSVALGAKPEIRGILMAGDQSLVNLSGEIIGVGETANGYRLLQVGEEHAIFQRGDEVITLSLYPDKEDAG